MKSRLYKNLRNLIIIVGAWFAISRAFGEVSTWPDGHGGAQAPYDPDQPEQVDGGDIAEE